MTDQVFNENVVRIDKYIEWSNQRAKLYDRLKASHDELLAALKEIAAFKGKTLISVSGGKAFSDGANAAFEDAAATAAAAIAKA